MNRYCVNVALFVLLVPSGTRLTAQHRPMPADTTHEQHLVQEEKDKELRQRGAAAMGFDQESATHHFLLMATGGVIQVEADDPRDRSTIERVRGHLRTITGEFRRGVFDKPFATHAEVPPGVPTLQRLAREVTYTFEQTAAGGRVRISSGNAEAVGAVHQFLRYQIAEHRTGDSFEIPIR